MGNIRRSVFSLLLLGVPLSVVAGGFGFGFSDNGVDAWDPEDYPGGYPATRSHRWDWGSQYRRFAPPSETGDNAGWGSWGSRKKHAKSDDDWTSSWGSDEPKRLKFGTGNSILATIPGRRISARAGDAGVGCHRPRPGVITRRRLRPGGILPAAQVVPVGAGLPAKSRRAGREPCHRSSPPRQLLRTAFRRSGLAREYSISGSRAFRSGGPPRWGRPGSRCRPASRSRWPRSCAGCGA